MATYACSAACAEFGIGHPNGPFCTSPEEAADVARVATLHQLRAAIITLNGMDLDMREWLASEDECHRDEFLKLRRRTLEALGHLEAMAAPKPEAA